MSELKATPGPWSVRDCPLKGAHTDAQDDGRIKLVDYTDGEYEGTLAIVQTDCSQANASLIAAAPDLYEALQSLLDALDDNGSCQYEALRELGRDALAKSRGEQ